MRELLRADARACADTSKESSAIGRLTWFLTWAGLRALYRRTFG
jgi:hypothetical protein